MLVLLQGKYWSRLDVKYYSIPVVGSGRTKLSKGFLKSARKQAQKVIEAIMQLDPGGQMPIVGVEPSEIYTLKDEYLDFFPGRQDVASIATRAYMIDEYLLRPGLGAKPGKLRIDNVSVDQSSFDQPVYLHGHCYQKSQPPAADGFPVGTHRQPGGCFRRWGIR